jgi:hypothetical protein
MFTPSNVLSHSERMDAVSEFLAAQVKPAQKAKVLKERGV